MAPGRGGAGKRLGTPISGEGIWRPHQQGDPRGQSRARSRTRRTTAGDRSSIHARDVGELAGQAEWRAPGADEWHRVVSSNEHLARSRAISAQGVQIYLEGQIQTRKGPTRTAWRNIPRRSSFRAFGERSPCSIRRPTAAAVRRPRRPTAPVPATLRPVSSVAKWTTKFRSEGPQSRSLKGTARTIPSLAHLRCGMLAFAPTFGP